MENPSVSERFVTALIKQSLQYSSRIHISKNYKSIINIFQAFDSSLGGVFVF